MHRFPIVSIVIPVRNGVRTIARALESVARQTYVSKEIIVVDGLSTDGTRELLGEYSHCVSNVICEPDQGIYDAMNKGVLRSKGDWLLFLGADDFLLGPEVLENIFSVALPSSEGRADLIFGEGRSNGNILKNSFDWRMLKNNSLNHQCVFYRRSVIEKYWYDTSYRIAADYKLNMSLYVNRAAALHYAGLVAEFGVEGISHRDLDAARRENNRVRREVLGPICGAAVNALRSIADAAKRLL